MRRWRWCFVFLLTTTACSLERMPQKAASLSEVAPQVAGANLSRSSLTNGGAQEAQKFLAYEHSVSIDIEEEKIKHLYDIAQSTCREATEALCTVLESRINTGRTTYAALRFRAKPSGIQKIITVLGAETPLTNVATTAEDLAGPISDEAKKLAMLKDYRSRLEALRNRAAEDVDALIKVNRELAQVQSEIESAEGTQASLVQRVDTEILRVDLQSQQHRALSKPIQEAIADFARHLSEGTAFAVTGLAYLLPWGVGILMGVWGLRKCWTRWKVRK